MAVNKIKRYDDGGDVPSFGDDWGDGNSGSGYDISTPPEVIDPGFYMDTPPSDAESGGSGSGTSSVGGDINGGDMGPGAFSGIDFINKINKALGTKMSGTDLLKYLAIGGGGVAGLMGANKPSVTKVGYQGGIPQLQANRTMQLAPPTRAQGYRPGQGGINYGGDVNYTQKAAQGGLMGMAHGGQYLEGNTDGMADELRTSIDGKQPAALSHGEFVIPADVVSHLGNGNSDAGAKKLYGMMDKIRQARTGTKKQGKQINPDKFMPGGSVGYAAGGKVRHFATGDAVGSAAAAGVTGTEQGLSNYIAPYVTDMLGRGEALANAPYQQYQGPLTAGASDLQNQAFSTASNLQVPGSIGAAAQTAGDIANKAQNMGYNPLQATSQFNAPAAYQASGAPQYNQLNATNVASTYTSPGAYQASGAPQYNQLNAGTVSSTFQAPEAYQAGNFTNQFQAPTTSAATNFSNQFQAPTPYQNTNFTSGTFGSEQAQQYMNPYLQASLAPQIEEARRQAQIDQQLNNANAIKSGGFGGGAGDIMARASQRDLGSKLANITGQGYNTAFTNAMSQYNADQGRNLQAQQATEASKQFGANQSMTAAQMMAQYGMSAQQAQEAARQFNQQQAMTGAQNTAQYGQAAQATNEASRQFGANLGLQGATTAGAQGLQAALANQQAGLTAGQGNINAALAAAQQAEASRQYGYGQSAQQAQQAAQLGLQAAQANQQAGLTAGQGNINAALEAARQGEASRQFGANQGMTAAQNAAQYGQAAQQANIGQQQFGANLGLQGLQLANQAAQTQGNLGISGANLGLAQLQEQAALGGTQRGIESEGIAADKKAFEEARDNPYKMAQFQQSLLNGLPITATNYQMAQPNAFQGAVGGATSAADLYKKLQDLGIIPKP